MSSKVYFTDLHTDFNNNLPGKLAKLCRRAGMLDQIDYTNKFTAIKLHFGEPGNLAYLRPNYAKVVVDLVKEAGGKAFLTDCNTLYVGGRKNALDHMDSAYTNGFNPFCTDAHVIIADGLKGTDEVLVPIDGDYIKEAKIGRALMDADILISLTHFKGHESTGFGGAIKNIGMGGGSRAGKMEQHNSGKPHVNQELCIGCKHCEKICAHNAAVVTDRKSFIHEDRCVGCGRCIGVCPTDAVVVNFDEANDILNCKMAEYAYAICKDRPCFHIALAIDISPNCDCHNENDVPITPDVGMFASFDPVALDQACADAVNKMPVNPGSILSEMPKHHHDHFHDTHPDTNWEVCLEHAEKIGLGQRDYELIVIK